MIGQQLRRLLNRPIVLGEKSLDVGASIGVAVCPEDAADRPQDLLKNADLGALPRQDRRPQAAAAHFTEELGQERQAPHRCSATSCAARIENGEIEAYFQPLVRVPRRMRVIGIRTLAAVPSGVSDPYRRPNSSSSLKKMTDHAADRPHHAQAIEPRNAGRTTSRVSVNVSPIQINSDLVDQRARVLKVSGLDPKRLSLK